MDEKNVGVRFFLYDALLAPSFLKTVGMDRREGIAFIRKAKIDKLIEKLPSCCDAKGRYSASLVTELACQYIDALRPVPKGGWLAYCCHVVLERIFPSAAAQRESGRGEAASGHAGISYRTGRLVLLQILRALYRHERAVLPFDPTRDFDFLDEEEILAQGYTREYLHMKKIIEEQFIYEFMRIGAEISPFDTLGHIAGVHYVAMYAARQLAYFKVPVDLALTSGAAFCHDIGKYGCKKNEEKRVPYLHYYYTDACCHRVGLNGIGHIEERLMDEHVVTTSGNDLCLRGEFADDNLNDLSWWTRKHVDYAVREAGDLLNLEFNLLGNTEEALSQVTGQAGTKRRKKLHYAKLPLFWRSFAYFIYRYFLRGGFLDGREGFLWHFLQGFWYRTLVDAKVLEIKKVCGSDPEKIKALLQEKYHISLH